jgi:hypothetical protein
MEEGVVPNLPVRGLGSVGVVTDVDPYNLPINGFTRGKNVRFHEGKVTHGPVFRDVSPTSTISNPIFAYGIQSATGYDTVLLIDDTFQIKELSNGVFTTRHAATTQSPLHEVTATTLANVIYVNRSDQIPLHRTSSNSSFTDLPNWPSTYRAKSLRSFGDFLIALNTTEGGVDHKNRVRFSTTALSNNVPTTWDETDTTESAGFNDLVQMKTSIVDGATLGSNFLIYSSDQVWMMEFVGGSFIFNFRKLFDDAGVMSQNCIVEVTGKHYVFDFDDIYITDGNTRQSICDGRVRDYIFNGIDYNKRGECFVLHNANLEEVYFCYHSGDDLAVFEDGDKCNRAAVYNYKEDTWTFQDLPNVVSGSIANISSAESYSSVSSNLTYDNAGGTYLSQESEFKRHALMVSKSTTGVSRSTMYGLDLPDLGSLTEAADTTVSKPAFLERTGIDLDEQGTPLSGYKVINTFYPQMSTPNADGNFEFTFGAADIPTNTPNYESAITFDSNVEYKVDTRISGRYLSYKLACPTLKDFSFSGMDLDVIVTGRR